MSDGKTHESYLEELLEQLLISQRRATNYLAILAWVTVVLLALALASGIGAIVVVATST